MREKRHYARVDVDLPVTVRFPSGGAVTRGKITEISLNGTACFLCGAMPEINSELELEFSLARYRIAGEVRLTGIVIHASETLDEYNRNLGYHYLVGVEFKDVPPEANSLLEDLCAALCKEYADSRAARGR